MDEEFFEQDPGINYEVDNEEKRPLKRKERNKRRQKEKEKTIRRKKERQRKYNQ